MSEKALRSKKIDIEVALPFRFSFPKRVGTEADLSLMFLCSFCRLGGIRFLVVSSRSSFFGAFDEEDDDDDILLSSLLPSLSLKLTIETGVTSISGLKWIEVPDGAFDRFDLLRSDFILFDLFRKIELL